RVRLQRAILGPQGASLESAWLQTAGIRGRARGVAGRGSDPTGSRGRASICNGEGGTAMTQAACRGSGLLVLGLAMLAALTCTCAVSAEDAAPGAAGADSRFRTVVYSGDEVYRLRGYA